MYVCMYIYILIYILIYIYIYIDIYIYIISYTHTHTHTHTHTPQDVYDYTPNVFDHEPRPYQIPQVLCVCVLNRVSQRET
jgi:hypothetical protein